MSDTMRFRDRIQYSYWGNIDYPSNEDAKKARDAKAKEKRAAGYRVRCSILRNQLRPYAGYGIPDGRIGNVYILDAFEARNNAGEE